MESITTKSLIKLTPEELAFLTFTMDEKEKVNYFKELARLQSEKIAPSGNIEAK